MNYRRFSDPLAPEPSTSLELCLWFPVGIEGSPPTLILLHLLLRPPSPCTYCELFSTNLPKERTSGKCFLVRTTPNSCSLCSPHLPEGVTTRQKHKTNPHKGYFLNAGIIILNYFFGAHTGAVGLYRFKLLMPKGWRTSALWEAKAPCNSITQLKLKQIK